MTGWRQRWIAVGLGAGLLWLGEPLAYGQVPSSVPLQSTWTQEAVEALVLRLFLDYASEQARRERIADVQESQLLADLAQKDSELRERIAALTKETRGRVALEQELGRVRAERSTLIEKIAERDRQFGAEIAAYRQALSESTGSAGPRWQEALRAYADGRRSEDVDAMEAVDAILDRASDLASAARKRVIAGAKEELKDSGEATTADVIAAWASVLKKDPQDSWGWYTVGNLYMEAGDLPRARDAFLQSQSNAADDRERMAGSDGVGDAARAAGDLQAARAAYQESLDLARRLQAQDPGNVGRSHDVALSLLRTGYCAAQAGDVKEAREDWTEALTILEGLARTSPETRAYQQQREDLRAWLKELPR